MVWDFLKKLFAAPVDAASLEAKEGPTPPASKSPRATGVSSPGHPARSAPAAEPPPDPTTDGAWQAAVEARTQFYTREFGPLPDDILKMLDTTGAWPGGGLYVIPAERLAPGTMMYATFGFTNPDMPATHVLEDVEYRHDELGRPTGATGNLRRKPRAAVAPGLAGYGYELAILTREGDGGDWPLYLLQWAVGAELRGDIGLLQRVETYDGLTVEDLQVGPDESVHVLIAKARAPLPASIDLPNGHAHLLLMTVVTDAEMKWSMQHGRMALLDRLVAAGVGQVSRRDRASVV